MRVRVSYPKRVCPFCRIDPGHDSSPYVHHRALPRFDGRIDRRSHDGRHMKNIGRGRPSRETRARVFPPSEKLFGHRDSHPRESPLVQRRCLHAALRRKLKTVGEISLQPVTQRALRVVRTRELSRIDDAVSGNVTVTLTDAIL